MLLPFQPGTDNLSAEKHLTKQKIVPKFQALEEDENTSSMLKDLKKNDEAGDIFKNTRQEAGTVGGSPQPLHEIDARSDSQ